MSDSVNRRTFLGQTAAAATAAGITAPAILSAANKAPSEKVTIGIMGMQRGLALAKTFGALDGVEIKYVCDTDDTRAGKAAQTVEKATKKKPQAIGDFRKILDDKDVDALIVAAPNHWHAPGTILGCSAGKHVYVEKPCCHNPKEGEMMVEAARKNKRAVQMGSQRRSSESIQEGIQQLKEGIIGDVSISERNLMGRGQYVRLGVSGSQERLQFDVSFTEPRFLGRDLAAGFDAFHKDVDYSNVASFSQRNTGGVLRLGFPVAEDTRLGLRYSYEHEEVYDVEADASPVIKDSEGQYDVSALGYTLAYDTRNLPQSPTQGLFLSFSQDLAGIGGNVNYIRSVADARGYYPITKKLTFAGRVQGGIINGWGDDQCPDDPGCLRLTDLFFKGGETIRGFERAGFGPRDIGSADNDALGGQIYYAATAEVRFPMPLIPENLGMQGAVFVDAGSLYDASETAKLVAIDLADSDDLRASAGFSIIWASPLGPLRADIAHAFLHTDYDELEVFRFGASTNF